MDQRASKRVYTVQGLDYWFSKLEDSWENAFSCSEIEWGRQMYRKGHVRSLEFRQGTAVMHCETEEEDGYAVVDWNGSGLQVRYSVDGETFGRSMAVAGLYELEEVLAEEVPFMVFDKETEEEEDEPEVEEEVEEIEESERELGLEFRLEKNRELEVRITLEGLVISRDSEQSEDLSPNEWATMVRITALARKAGFFYSKKRDAFYLNESEKILHFFDSHFASWKKKFPLKLPSEVTALATSPRNVVVSAVARKERGNKISLEWQFRVGKRLLTEDEMEQIYRSRKEFSIIQRAGFASLPEDRRRVLREWRENHPTFSSGQWPAYMLFSLFQTEGQVLQLDKGARKWKDSLGRKPSSKPLELPSDRKSVV